MKFYKDDKVLAANTGYGPVFDFGPLRAVVEAMEAEEGGGTIEWDAIPFDHVVPYSIEGYYRLVDGRPLGPNDMPAPTQQELIPVGDLTLKVQVLVLDESLCSLRMVLS